MHWECIQQGNSSRPQKKDEHDSADSASSESQKQKWANDGDGGAHSFTEAHLRQRWRSKKVTEASMLQESYKVMRGAKKVWGRRANRPLTCHCCSCDCQIAQSFCDQHISQREHVSLCTIINTAIEAVNCQSPSIVFSVVFISSRVAVKEIESKGLIGHWFSASSSSTLFTWPVKFVSRVASQLAYQVLMTDGNRGYLHDFDHLFVQKTCRVEWAQLSALSNSPTLWSRLRLWCDL